ncbi:MAG: GNAT family N-acetyltransferase, partial [candidate division Zixibacteria bacterium]
VDVEAHLTNIAVVKSFRRMSVARRMLEEIVTRAQDNECEFILLEVRPSNEEAIAFYEEYKFRLLYRRPNYYRRPVEDALVMVRYLEKN